MAAAMPHTSYRSNDFSIFHFCPFKSFCFSYRLLRSLQSSFIRSNCARTPSRQSGSIFLYSPVRLRIVLLFSFICSDRHTQSIRFCTSLSVFVKVCFCHNFSTQSYHNFLLHIRHILSILTFLSAHFKGTFRAFICPFCLFYCL